MRQVNKFATDNNDLYCQAATAKDSRCKHGYHV